MAWLGLVARLTRRSPSCTRRAASNNRSRSWDKGGDLDDETSDRSPRRRRAPGCAGSGIGSRPVDANLTPDEEVPEPTLPDGYAGSGTATVTISDDESELHYEVSYDGLTGPPTAAHIHLGAPGTAGPPFLDLAHGPSPFSGTLTESDFTINGGPSGWEAGLQAIRDGETYINIHTEQNPEGEIRGQLLMGDGKGATPPPTSTVEARPGAGTTPPVAPLLALLGAAALLFALQRLYLRRG